MRVSGVTILVTMVTIDIIQATPPIAVVKHWSTAVSQARILSEDI